MDDCYYEDQINDLSEQTCALSCGYRVLALCLLIFFSVFNVGDMFMISRFHQLFQNALGPDHPLPFLTCIFLDGQSLVTGLAILWPILGVILALRIKNLGFSVTVLICLLIVVVIQICLTWVGFILPMESVFTGQSAGK